MEDEDEEDTPGQNYIHLTGRLPITLQAAALDLAAPTAGITKAALRTKREGSAAASNLPSYIPKDLQAHIWHKVLQDEYADFRAIAGSIESEYDRIDALGYLIKHLPPGRNMSVIVHADLRRQINTITDERCRLHFIEFLSKHLPPGSDGAEAYDDLCGKAAEFQGYPNRAEALGRLADHLPSGYETEGHANIRKKINFSMDDTSCIYVFMRLASNLPLKPNAAAAAHADLQEKTINMEDSYVKTEVLKILAKYRPSEAHT